jgi:YHS domain-containing protein
VNLNITDDGIGFSQPEKLELLAEAGHYGMVGIAERVQSLDGTLNIKSAPKQGVQLHITLPVSAANQPMETVRDPVCSTIIQPQQAYGSVVYEGERYYFCCPVCQGAFQRQPEAYIAAL